MAMTWDRFDALVARLEGEAATRPASYKLRVGLLAALGYVYILGVLALVVALAAGIFALLINRWSYGAGKIAWVLLAFAFVIVRSLWVRLPPPEGRPLVRTDAPALFDMIDEVRRALRGPRVHQVLLTDDFNAAIVQLPRLGIFGWQRNYLIVGLPLMHALSPEQFRAVLAHEFGHLSGAHGRFGAWIYRVRQTWAQLLERLDQQQRFGSFVFTIFFGWYAPFFSAYSFVLARTQEYEADRASAEVAGARTAADALLAAELRGAFLHEQFWPDTYKGALREATPPVAPFANMRRALQQELPALQAEQWLQRALNTISGGDDTHPSLSARLAALQQAPRVVDAPAVSAADALLGDGLDSLQAELNGQWREGVAEPWRERYTAAQNDRRRLDSLNVEAAQRPLSHEEAVDRAQLTEELIDEAAALPLYEAIIEQDGNCAPSLFSLGRLRLQNGDERGISLIERAMGQDNDALLPGCQAIYNFLTARGEHERARNYYARGMDRATLLNAADEERAQVTQRDTLVPHDAPPEQVAIIVQHVAQFAQVQQAYLARKQVQHLPEHAMYVLCIVAHNECRRDLTDEEQQALMECVSDTDITWPGFTSAYVVNKNHMLHDKIKRVPGSLIFDRAAENNR